MPIATHFAALAIILAQAGSSQWWLSELEYDQVGFDGSGVVVAVIDTGVDATHPDLAGTLVGGADFSGQGNSSGTLPVGPSYFHGTMVSSLIAGQGGPYGVMGVAPAAKIMPISIGLGLDGADTDYQLAQAVRWAVENGADIINLSLSRNSAKWPQSWDEAFSFAFENDVVIVAASGNREQGEFATAPAVIPGVVSVTALDKDLQRSERAGSDGIGIAIAAPGEDLLGSFPGGGYRAWGGSSAAAPLVSGTLALMAQADPEASANDLIERLIRSARDLGEPGFDSEYGFGLVNPVAAVSSDLQASENPLGSLANWISLYRAEISEDQAGFVLPPGQASETETGLAAPPNSAVPANPLLYLLLVPLLLLVYILGRAFGR